MDADRVITDELIGRLNNTLSINADHVVISSGDHAGQSIQSYTDWKAQQVEEDMDQKMGYRIEIISTQDVLSDDIPTTTLQVRVYHGQDNVTNTFADNKFVWQRKSADAAGDRQWSHTGKTLQLGKSDVRFSASYTCNLVQ